MANAITRRTILSSAVALGVSAATKDETEMLMRKRGRNTIAFESASLVGVFWPWGGPTLKDPTNFDVWDENPFSFEGTFIERMTPKVMTMLRNAGFQGFRFQVMPAPWLVAIAEGNEAQVERLNKMLDDAVRHSLKHGFSVMICPFYTGYAGWDAESVLNGLDNPKWLALKELWVRWVGVLRKYSPRRVALELFNEPPINSRYPLASWNDTLQPDLYKLLRRVAPKHTLVVTSSDWSSKEEFVKLNPIASGFDGNTIYTYHPLRPVVPSLQGYVYNQYQYTTGIHYPPDPKYKAGDIARMQAAVNADARLSSAEKTATIAGLTADLNDYFDTPQDRNWIKAYLNEINAWAAGYNIPPGALFAGEYGMTRPNIGFPGIDIPGYEGGSRLDRIHLYGDWSSEIIIAGHRRAPIHLDTLDYGLTNGINADIGELDPLIVRAIAPNRHLLRW